ESRAGLLVIAALALGLALARHPLVEQPFRRRIGRGAVCAGPGQMDGVAVSVHLLVGVDPDFAALALVDGDQLVHLAIAGHRLTKVGDLDGALHTTADIQRAHHQVVVGGVVDVDQAVAVKHLQLAAPGVHDLAEELHVAAFDLDAVELDPLQLTVPPGLDATAVPGPELHVGIGVAGRLALLIDRLGVGDSAIQTGQVDVPIRDAALQRAVDVEVAGTDEHVVAGDGHALLSTGQRCGHRLGIKPLPFEAETAEDWIWYFAAPRSW